MIIRLRFRQQRRCQTPQLLFTQNGVNGDSRKDVHDAFHSKNHTFSYPHDRESRENVTNIWTSKTKTQLVTTPFFPYHLQISLIRSLTSFPSFSPSRWSACSPPFPCRQAAPYNQRDGLEERCKVPSVKIRWWVWPADCMHGFKSQVWLCGQQCGN